jgi:hypothetical protein
VRYNLRMHRYLRITVVALGLVLLVVGSALANGSPRADEHRSPVAASHQPSPATEKPGSDEKEAEGAAPPSQAELDRLAGLLDQAGISATSDQIAALAAKYGVGGAVRILAWADATGGDTAKITDLRDAGMGWGAIAKQLAAADSSVSLRPGIGWIMSGGHGQSHADAASAGKAKGKATAPGQSNSQPDN